ncbi:MAG: hypothetical protein ACKVY0_18705 [Prosthecobacter sp.]|uniref:hypothetical protein n=1 Tax=Prosthecobacter sp. TaxID=1965333 RepID=UPI003903D6BD
MKLRLDLLRHLTTEDVMEEAVATVHRFKPEPLFSITGTGSLSSASMQERAREEALDSLRVRGCHRKAPFLFFKEVLNNAKPLRFISQFSRRYSMRRRARMVSSSS